MSFVEEVQHERTPDETALYEVERHDFAAFLRGTSDRIKVGDFIGSYKVVRVTGGNHNDTPAKTLTIADRDGVEVGRLIVVPTEGTEGFLEFVRVFPSEESYYKFRDEIERGLPPGVRRIPARALVKGDLIVDATGRPMSRVEKLELLIRQDAAIVSVTTVDKAGVTFPPQTFGPEDELNVRAS